MVSPNRRLQALISTCKRAMAGTTQWCDSWGSDQQHKPTKASVFRRVFCLQELEDRCTPTFGLGLATTFGGTLFDAISTVTVDNVGNTYIGGAFRGTIDVDPGAGVTTLSAAAQADAFIAKYSLGGQLEWARTYGGAGNDAVTDLALNDNDLMAVGYFSGTVDFDHTSGTANETASGATDGFLLWLDSFGGYDFHRAFGGTGNDLATGIVVQSVDNLTYVTSVYDGATSNGGFDVSVRRYTDLNLAWAVDFGGTGNDVVRDITIDSDGRLYIAGSFSNTVDFDPGAVTQNASSQGLSDAYISKLDVNGNLLFYRTFGGTGNDSAESIALTATNQILTAGYYRNTVDFNPGSGQFFRSSAGENDMFLQRLDASGGFEFVRTWGGTLNDQANEVAVDPLGNIFVGGDFQDTIDADPGLASSSRASAGGTDALVVKLNSAGNFSQAWSFGGNQNEKLNSLAFINATDFVVAGSFEGTADFDPSSAVLNRNSFGDSDSYFARYSVRPDLLIRNASGQWILSKNNGSSYSPATVGSWYEGANWQDVSSGDVDADGDQDVFGRTINGQWWIGKNNGQGVLTNMLLGQWSAVNWRNVTIVDWNLDGFADIVGRNPAGQWWVGINNNGASLTTMLIGGWAEAANWRDIKVVDYNNDKRPDIVGRTSAGQWWVAINQSNNMLSNQVIGLWNEAQNWRDVSIVKLQSIVIVAARTSAGKWYASSLNNVSNGLLSLTSLFDWNEAAQWRDVHFFVEGIKLVAIGRTIDGQWWNSSINIGTFNPPVSSLLTTWAPQAGWNNVTIRDLNGDGIADIAGRTSDGQWWVSLRQPNGTVTTSLWWAGNPVVKSALFNNFAVS